MRWERGQNLYLIKNWIKAHSGNTESANANTNKTLNSIQHTSDIRVRHQTADSRQQTRQETAQQQIYYKKETMYAPGLSIAFTLKKTALIPQVAYCSLLFGHFLPLF